jgi:hypothetical protein
MKLMNRPPTRTGNLARLVIYETLPVVCLAMLWVIASSNALESKAHQRLEPHANDPAYWTRDIKTQLLPANGLIPTGAVANSDDDRE